MFLTLIIFIRKEMKFVSVQNVTKYYLIGMFFNLFAPGTVGGDVSRIYYVVRDEQAQASGRAVTTMHAAMSVLMDRAIGMIVLVWLGAAGLMLFPEYAVPPTVRSVTFSLALGFVAAVLLAPLLRRILPEDGHPIVVKLRLALRSYWTHWRALCAALVLSLLLHLIQVGDTVDPVPTIVHEDVELLGRIEVDLAEQKLVDEV